MSTLDDQEEPVNNEAAEATEPSDAPTPHRHHKVKRELPKTQGFGWGRVLVILVFVLSCGVFLIGVGHWYRQTYQVADANDEQKLFFTPDQINDELDVLFKDKVEYGFWPLVAVPTVKRSELLRSCLQEAQQFLSATEVVAKSAFVWKSRETLPMMVRYYATHKPEMMFSKAVGPKRFTVLNVNGTVCAQLLFAFNSSPDMEFAFFFDPADQKWKMDWKQFARYQSMDWDGFVRGEGEEMGEFRLWLVRDRISEDNDNYVYQMIAPGRNGTLERAISRPKIKVAKRSDLGELLFKYAKVNEFSKESANCVLSFNDHIDELRVRVVVARSKTSNHLGEYSFTLVRLIGEGWYGIDPPEES